MERDFILKIFLFCLITTFNEHNCFELKSVIPNVLKSKLGLDQNITEVCYGVLGCFNNSKPWYSLTRPAPLPEPPQHINTSVTLFYRDGTSVKKEHVDIHEERVIENYDCNKPYNVFITHGFSSDGNSSWVSRLAKAYLKHRDANVFAVDWEGGSKKTSYLQAVANTRVVGAELSLFLHRLIKSHNITLKSVHLIGHSLGSHISAYVAKNHSGSIGQLTALDPAQPGFEDAAKEVRLDKDDAEFVDVLHTNTRPTIPLLGFGFRKPLGHCDYYFNGGLIQPGCKTPSLSDLNITSIKDILHMPVEMIEKWIGCSHGRSYRYYTESLENDYCKFWGRKAGVISKTLQKYTLGFSEDIVQKFIKCTPTTCSPVGLDAKANPLRGTFLISTRDSSPFCNNDFYTQYNLEFSD